MERKRRVQQTPEERTTDRDLGAPSPPTVPTKPYQSGDTGGRILGEEHKERQTSKAQEEPHCGVKLSSVLELEEKKEREIREQ